MNLDHDFVQVRKLSEDQKKVFIKNGTLFSPNSGEDQKKKGLYKKFPRIQVEACAHMHTRVKLLEGMQMKTILKLLWGIQSNYWGRYIPPRVSAPLSETTPSSIADF